MKTSNTFLTPGEGFRLLRCAILIYLVAAAVPPSLHGERIRCKERAFSIDIPDTWRRIPKGTIEEVMGQIGQIDTTFSRQKIEYAFQRRSADQWFAFPHILIEYTVLDNPWKRRLEEYRTLYTSEFTRKGKGLAGSITPFTRVDSIIFTERSNIIWVESVTLIGRAPIIRMLAGLIPTPDGLLKVYAYSREEEYAADKKVFAEIISSVAFGEEAEEAFTDSLSPVKIIMMLVFAAFAVLFVISVKKNLA